MRYIFWNTNNKKIDDYIYTLIIEYNPSIIALAEYKGDLNNLVSNIKINTQNEYYALSQFACRVCILVNKKFENKIIHCQDHTNYTIKIIPYNSYNENHIVAFVHLPSKSYDNKEKNRHILEQITLKINDLNDNINRKVLIFGDFNLNPYENAMTYLTGCNAVSSRQIAMKISRSDRNEQNKKYYFYYNPMWNFLGDNIEPCGSFFYNKTSDHSNYWNIFDQFVVSPELIKDIRDIKIIKDTQNGSLGNKYGIPNVSDHYPLYFRLGGFQDGK